MTLALRAIFFRICPRKDLLIAGIVFLLASSASAFVFETISLRQRKDLVVVEHIREGKTRYAIFSNESCFGYLTVDLSREREISTITLEGEISIAAENTLFHPMVKGTLVFNNLGQLGSSIFRVQAEGAEFGFGTEGIRNMRAVFRSDLAGHRERVETHISGGPFVLARNGDTYKLSGTIPGNLRRPQIAGASEAFLNQLKLDVRDSAGVSQCDGKNLKPIDLSEHFRRIGNLLAR